MIRETAIHSVALNMTLDNWFIRLIQIVSGKDNVVFRVNQLDGNTSQQRMKFRLRLVGEL